MDGRKSGMSWGRRYRAASWRRVFVNVHSCTLRVGGGRWLSDGSGGMYTVPPHRVKCANISSQEAPFVFVMGAHLVCLRKHQIDRSACHPSSDGAAPSDDSVGGVGRCSSRKLPWSGWSWIGFGVMMVGWLSGVVPSSWCCSAVRELRCCLSSASAAKTRRRRSWMCWVSCVYAFMYMLLATHVNQV